MKITVYNRGIPSPLSPKEALDRLEALFKQTGGGRIIRSKHRMEARFSHVDVVITVEP